MKTITIIIFIVSGILFLINMKLSGSHIEGLKSGLNDLGKTFLMIVGAFLLTGIIEVLIPEEFVKLWLSSEAGIKGVFIGLLVGMVLVMGPYASYPIMYSIYLSGAGLGTVVSMITAWSLINVMKMPYESAFLDMDFYVKRMAISIPFTIVAGLIGYLIDIIFL